MPKFKLIQAVMYVLVTCTYEKNQKQLRKRDDAVFPYGIFQRSKAANAIVGGPNWPRFYSCPHYLQV